MSDCKLNETPIGMNCQTHDVIFSNSVAECPYAALAALTAERDALREAARAVVAERHNVDSGHQLFAKVNVLKLSALAAILPNTGGEK